jgi:hypothetical protein
VFFKYKKYWAKLELNQPASEQKDTMTDMFSRAVRLDQMLHEIYDANGIATTDEFQAITVLLEDSKLEKDIEALIVAKRGLQRIYAKQVNCVDRTDYEGFCRGRMLQMIDELAWSLMRLAAKRATQEIKIGSDEHMVLTAIARFQPNATARLLSRGFSTANLQMATTHLESCGAIARFGARNNSSWEVTPVGRQRLKEIKAQEPVRA